MFRVIKLIRTQVIQSEPRCDDLIAIIGQAFAWPLELDSIVLELLHAGEAEHSMATGL